MNNAPTYKRGTIRKNGRLYGFHPDGTLYRIYAQSDIPFLQIVDINGSTFLRIRQATEQGYTDCPVFGVCVTSAIPPLPCAVQEPSAEADWQTHSLVANHW